MNLDTAIAGSGRLVQLHSGVCKVRIYSGTVYDGDNVY